MKISTKTVIFHKIDAVDDVPTHDVATAAANTQDLGSDVDFEIDADNNINAVPILKIASDTSTALFIRKCCPQ